ncbi:MAG: MotE family protein [Alphaproteobacteria bacterium]|nr:MotE family protein [Alphaproteobacteria bacterium]MCB9974088.1 MotE family protein [Rhodospirillales bacterium]
MSPAITPNRLLLALIIVAFLSFTLKLTEVVSGLRGVSGSAYAGEKRSLEDLYAPLAGDESGHENEAGAEAHSAEGTGKGESKEPHAPESSVSSDGKKPLVYEDNNAKMPEWKDAGDAEIGLSDARKEVVEDMAARRAKLDGMEKDLRAREALLKAAERELDRKYKELTRLKTEIEGLLEKQSEEEQNRVKSLVKVYEGMKPKDAARIFDTLDIDILIEVVSNMSERKLSPILAAMNPERARTVTIMLAQQKQLPSLPQGN